MDASTRRWNFCHRIFLFRSANSRLTHEWSVVNFTNILRNSFSTNFLLPKKYKAILQVQKICTYNFQTKKLLIKCWWNWHLVVRDGKIDQKLEKKEKILHCVSQHRKSVVMSNIGKYIVHCVSQFETQHLKIHMSLLHALAFFGTTLRIKH